MDYDYLFETQVFQKNSKFCRLQQNNSLQETNNSLRGTSNEFHRIINIFQLFVVDRSFDSYNFLERILLLSGDIELNPGPVTNSYTKSKEFRYLDI